MNTQRPQLNLDSFLARKGNSQPTPDSQGCWMFGTTPEPESNTLADLRFWQGTFAEMVRQAQNHFAGADQLHCWNGGHLD